MFDFADIFSKISHKQITISILQKKKKKNYVIKKLYNFAFANESLLNLKLMGKIKVLHILNRFNLGGPTYYAAYLTKFLPEDFETKLIGGVQDKEEGNSEFVLQQYGITPIVIDTMHRSIGFNDFAAYKEIKQIIKEYQPDIVHTHAAKAGMLGRLAAKRCGVKIIIHTFHGHVFDKYFNGLKTHFYKSLERFLARQSTKIIALSNLQKYDLVEKYKICRNDKVRVIPLGLDLDQYLEKQDIKRESFRKAYRIADDEIAIGIIGRLAPIKNHSLFLDAMALVLQHTHKKIKIFIVGDGDQHSFIEQKLEQLNLSYANYNSNDSQKQCPDVQVYLTSWIKEIDIVNAGLDIVALTSLNEGTPGSLIEAQAANKAIVATNVGGVADTVIDGETALLAESENIEDVAEKMLRLIEDDKLRAELSSHGAEYVKEKYHYLNLAQNMADLYRELLTKQTTDWKTRARIHKLDIFHLFS